MGIHSGLAFVLLMHLSFSQSRPQCDMCDQTSCNCSRQNLEQVPAVPSRNIDELDISFNHLEKLTDDDFITYGALKTLLVSNNKMKIIQERAFDPLAGLVKLDLSFNELDALSARWFKNLVSLQHLNLLGNRYESVAQSSVFEHLKNLRALYFGGPYLKAVGKTDFVGLGGLEDLLFDGKNLQHCADGCFREFGGVGRVTLGLSGLFDTNPALVKVILSDVVHPNATLTLFDTRFTVQQMLLLAVAVERGATGIAFKNVTATPGACVAFVLLSANPHVSMFALEDVKLVHRLSAAYFFIWIIPDMDNVEVVVLKNIQVLQFYSFPALDFLHPMMKAMKKLSLINSMFFAIPCDSSARLSKLEYLDLSDNIFSDDALSQMMCDGDGVLWNLQTLNVSGNHLLSINSRLGKLQNIDMSRNGFQNMPVTCHWPPRLRFLNLSSAHLTEATSCLPESLRVLDLSNNDLTVFDIKLPFLAELYLSSNKISSLPDGALYPRLTFLSLQNNNLHTFGSGDLDDYVNLRILEASSDTYVCSCDFLAFMAGGVRKHQVRIADEFKSYVCDSPYVLRGKSVVDATPSLFECHAAFAFSLLCSVASAVVLLAALLCHKFNVLWYMRMTWAWVRAKRKPKFARAELRYDAFVSYSEMDSGWVEAHLVPELERAEPPLRLCLHKRDFAPGGWILDNIMEAIELSYKTVFILSQHFVRSEWCKYELDYTHFRLFDHNDDAVVLVLLEPIDKNTIPKKFCKLRRVMNSRTYLKWPDDGNRIPRFWTSLRTAIIRPLTDNAINELSTEQ